MRMTMQSNDFAALGDTERGVVRAVLRCVTNALTTAAMFAGLLWAILCVHDQRLALEPLIPVVALVSLAVSMALSCRGLQPAD
jgi:hypothetical protein